MALPHASKEGASLADFFQLLRQRKALIFLILGLVVLTTAAVTAFLPKWYYSSLNVRVEKPEGGMKLFQAQASGYYDPVFQQDQLKIMQSGKVLYLVIDKLKLNEKLAPLLGSTVPLQRDVTFNYLLEKMLRVETPRGSSLIEIGVYAQNPEL